MSLYPLTFSPVFQSYTWGGRKLVDLLGRQAPDGKVAESWEVSAHPNGPTPVQNGPLSGRYLAELLAEYGERLVGARNRDSVERGRFPLLIKLLDANEWLSVQVHPRDDYALSREGDLGKTEMWVVLDADPGAELIFGFDAPTNVAAVRQAIDEDRLESILHRQPVRAGDVFFVPAGTVHALGPGLLLAEIQQSSDTTYRLYDWGRDADGEQPRPLHLDRGVEVLDLSRVRPGPARPAPSDSAVGPVEVLASCAHFETQRLTLADGETRVGSCDGATFELWCPLTGSLELSWRGEAVTAERLRWLLLPADLGEFEVRSRERSTVLRVFTPAPN